jgi:hypothetical protein
MIIRLMKQGATLTWGPGLSSDPGSGATAVVVAVVVVVVVVVVAAPGGDHPQMVGVAVVEVGPMVVAVAVAAGPMVVVAAN